MTLIDWKPWAIDEEIRHILKDPDASLAECKEWARSLVRSIIGSHWQPGTPFTWREAQQVGLAFEKALARAGRRLPPMARLRPRSGSKHP